MIISLPLWIQIPKLNHEVFSLQQVLNLSLITIGAMNSPVQGYALHIQQHPWPLLPKCQ